MNWAEAGKWAVMFIVAALTVRGLWRRVKRDDQALEYNEAVRRESEGLDLEEDYPPAA